MESLVQQLLGHDYMPKGYCYLWQPSVLWMHVIADSVIAIAFVAMPLVLLMFSWRRRLPHRWMLYVFCGFSLLCGGAHLFEVIAVWTPYYYLAGILKAAAACASLAMTVMLFPLAPRLIRVLESLRREDDADSLADDSFFGREA